MKHVKRVIDEATDAAVRERFVTDSLGMVMVKGKDTPLKAYRMMGEIGEAAD
ncbi:MAG: hypothetical protein JW765_05745 [Deltaproteobacteria bacterium]|nr:hypothetical protein [Candidatus Zymogenaceae bacterium]